MSCGCITTTKPNGDTETRIDAVTAIAIMQGTLTMAQQGLELYMSYQAQHATVDAAEFAQQVQIRQANIAQLQAMLTALITAVKPK